MFGVVVLGSLQLMQPFLCPSWVLFALTCTCVSFHWGVFRRSLTT